MKHKNDLEFNAKLNGKQKFALRKLTVGLTTVMLGTTFAITSQSATAHADEAKDSEPQTTEVVKTDKLKKSVKAADKSNPIVKTTELKPSVTRSKADKSENNNQEKPLDLAKVDKAKPKTELKDKKIKQSS